ncbi:MAG: Efflux ABC transporter, ATP-binding protein, partial [uncultured Nocardioidaceae bacterium]
DHTSTQGDRPDEAVPSIGRRDGDRRRRHRPDHRPRRDRRLPRPERRRQDHHRRHVPRADVADRREHRGVRRTASACCRARPGLRRDADRRPASRLHGAGDGPGGRRSPRTAGPGRCRRRAGRPRSARRPTGEGVLRRRAAAAQVRPGPRPRPGARHPRRADDRHGRGRPAGVLGHHASRRSRRPHDRVRHPLPRRGRRVRRPHRADGARPDHGRRPDRRGACCVRRPDGVPPSTGGSRRCPRRRRRLARRPPHGRRPAGHHRHRGRQPQPRGGVPGAHRSAPSRPGRRHFPHGRGGPPM